MQGSEFRTAVLGPERALEARLGRARLVFGLGPARELEDGPARARQLHRSLRPAIRALHWCRQVHGADVRVVDGGGAAGAACAGEGDALVTTAPAVAVAVWTADCVPVLVSAAGGVAAIHSGWRGTAAGIVRRAVAVLVRATGSPREQLWAAIGPAIGPCHYPVGPEVVTQLRGTHVPEEAWLHPGPRVDLRAAVRAQLLACGLVEEQVVVVGGCTACAQDLASFRRDGASAGRQLSLVYLAGEAASAPRS